MPRPTPTQIAYGSATVVLSTLAMLLLSGASSGPGLALVTVVAVALGVLVAVVVAGGRLPEPDVDPALDGERLPAPARAARSGPHGGGQRRAVQHSLRR